MLFHLIFSSLLNGMTDILDIVLEDTQPLKSRKPLSNKKYNFGL